MRLSLAMIVRDEAARIGACLASVKGLVDEVVILDTGSTDGTGDLARSLGARVEAFPWVDDFSAARNAALARCTGDWILVLDADETVDGLDHPAIRRALEAEGVGAYRLWLRNYLRGGAFIGADGAPVPNDGRYAEGARFSHHWSRRGLRLFRAQGAPVFRGRVHETADAHFEAGDAPILDLEAVIHHFGKTDMDRDQAKQAEYFRLALAQAAEAPGDLPSLYHVIQEGLMVEAWPEVLEAAQAYVAHSARAPLLVHLGGGKALQGLGRLPESLAWFATILAVQPRNGPALAARAASFRRMDRRAEAQADLLAALEAEPGFTLPFLDLSSLLEEEGDLEAARAVLEAGLDQNPRDALLWEALVGLSARHRDPRVAGDAWDALRAVPDGGRGIWHQVVAHALLARGEAADAGRVLDLALETFPGDGELMALRGRVEAP